MLDFNKGERYKHYEGKRIELVSMTSDPQPIEPGTRGTVQFVDSLGTLHMKWDNGRTLGVIPGEDRFKIVD